MFGFCWFIAKASKENSSFVKEINRLSFKTNFQFFIFNFPLPTYVDRTKQQARLRV